jgi:hypothetical protein
MIDNMWPNGTDPRLARHGHQSPGNRNGEPDREGMSVAGCRWLHLAGYCCIAQTVRTEGIVCGETEIPSSARIRFSTC